MGKSLFQMSQANPAFDNTIVAILFTENPVSRGKVQTLLESNLLSFERFHSVVKEGEWVYESSLDMDYHLVQIDLPSPAGKGDLKRFVSDLYRQPLDCTRPLWRFYLLQLSNGQGVVVAQMHHSIGDGTTLVEVFFSLTTGRNPPITVPKRKFPSWFDTLANPFDFADRAVIWIKGVLYGFTFFVFPRDSENCLKIPFGSTLSGEKFIAYSDPIPLSHFKQVKEAIKGTVNDVIIASMSAAMREYLIAHDDPCLKTNSSPRIQLAFPHNSRLGKINVRDPKQFGNQFTALTLRVPIQERDPLELLRLCKEQCQELKTSPLPVMAAFWNKLALAALPVDKYMEASMKEIEKVTGVFSNVPGPIEQVSFAGERVLGMNFFAPVMTGFSMSAISYNGSVNVGILTDKASGVNPEELVGHFQTEFYQLYNATTGTDVTAQQISSPFYQRFFCLLGLLLTIIYFDILPLYVILTLASNFVRIRN